MTLPRCTTRQAIVSDETIRLILDEFIEVGGHTGLPTRELEAKNRLAEQEYRVNVECAMLIKSIKEKLAGVEAEVSFEINQAVNGDGKKTYSNEEQRAVARAVELGKNKVYQDLTTDLLEAQRVEARETMELAKVRNTVNYLINVSYALKSAAEIIAGLCYEASVSGPIEVINKLENTLRPRG